MVENKNKMLLQFEPFRLQFGNREIIEVLDHLIPLMKADPDRFKIGANTLIDTHTDWEYWISNAAYQAEVWKPNQSGNFGLWQGRRFRRAWKKYILKNIRANRQSEFKKEFDQIYLNDSSEMTRSEFIAIYDDHMKYRENSETLKDLWEKYIAMYYIISGKEK